MKLRKAVPLLLLVLAAAVHAPAVEAAPTLSVTPSTVAPGGTLTVTLAGGPGNPTDWIGLNAANGADTTLLDWKYLNGSRTAPSAGLAAATLTFSAPAVAGTYNFRLFASNGYTKLATSPSVTVGTASGPTLTVSKATAAPGESVTVTLAGGPGTATDWIALHATAAADSTYLDWKYLNGSRTAPTTGLTAATLAFTMPTAPGTYNFRLFKANGSTKLATSGTVTVQGSSGTPTLTVSRTTAAPGESLTLTAANGPGTPTDWIALHASGAADTTYLDWKYLNGTRTPPASGQTSATVSFTMPTAPGTYNFRFFKANGSTKLATSATVTVSGASASPTLTVNATTVAPGASVTVAFANGPGNKTDWVGLHASSAADTTYLDWKYLNGSRTAPVAGVRSGSLTFAMPTAPGTYNFRLFKNNASEKLATSANVTVQAAPALGVSTTAGAPGQTVQVTVANGPGNKTDWVALHATSAGDATYLDWKYLSGTRVAPTTGLRSATIGFSLPSTPGTYNFRFYANNGATKLATSPTVTVQGGLPSLSINDVTLVEGNAGTTSFVFTVSLSASFSSIVTAGYATANGTASSGSDYTAASGTLTFPAGTTSRTVAVGVKGDTAVELDETFFVNLSGATNATLLRAQGKGTITNDDQGPPAAPTLVSPSGSVSTRTPAYRWNAASSASEYLLQVHRLSGALVLQQTVAPTACTAGVCTVTPSTPLGSGAHRFWVQAKNSVGASPFSAPMTFEVTVASGSVVTVTSHDAGQTVSTRGFLLSGTAVDPAGVTGLAATLDDPVLGKPIDNRPVQVAAGSGRFTLWVRDGQVSAGQNVTVTLVATLAGGQTATTAITLAAADPDPRLAQLVNRITFGPTPDLLWQVSAQGAAAFLDEQLNPAAIDDTAAETALAALPRTSKAQLQAYALTRAIKSRRQLREVLTTFWDNHFNTDINKSLVVAYEVAENDLFRANALGSFRDLLEASATSPAMLVYLDNADSVKAEPNENYARELMELHTLSVDGGYTQKDVVNVAKAFTGWTVQGGQFFFNAANHDTTQKVVLGQTIPAGGDISDGRTVLDILAAHPSTARFICKKLARLFVSDTPGTALLDGCSSTYLSTQGNIGAVVRELLESPDFADASSFRAKVKDPAELEVSLIRAFGAATAATDLLNPMRDMGMTLFENPVPTGWSETGDDWVSSNALLQRLRWVNKVAYATPSSTATSLDLKGFFSSNGYETAEGIAGFLFQVAFEGEHNDEERQVAMDILTLNGTSPFSLGAADADARLKRLVGTVLAYPGYQFQ